MTIKRYIATLKHYGCEGVINWILRLFKKRDRDPLLDNLRAHISAKETPKPGITLIGDFSANNSLSKVLRDFAQSLQMANISHQTVDLTEPIPNNFVLNRYSQIIGMFRDFPVGDIDGCRQHRIIFWEFDTGFASSHPDFVEGNPILVFSKYCQESIRKQVQKSLSISLIRYPFHFESSYCIPASEIRAKYQIPSDTFMVFFNFDYRSSYYRKNPQGLLSAFLKAFKPSDDAVLVFKTIGSNQKKELSNKLRQLVKRNNAENRVVFIDEYLSNDELVSLTASCDVYASLHRGEGFGLGVAEAMSLGKAVVVSNCGATTEFCHKDTAEIVPYSIVSVPTEQLDHPDYKWITQWPEPDITAASISLKKLFDNPMYRRNLGLRAQAFIKRYYSIENFKKSMMTFLAH